MYKLLYISIYDFFLWLRKKDDPEFKAVVGLSIVIIQNVMILSFILKLPEKLQAFNFINTKYVYLLFSIAVIIFNYFLFVFKKQFQVIYEKYSQKTKKYRSMARIIAFLFMIEGLLIAIAYGLTARD